MIHNLIKTLGLAGLTVLFYPAALIVPCASALGQTKTPEAEPAPPPAAAPQLTPEQLEKLVGPIALYPIHRADLEK